MEDADDEAAETQELPLEPILRDPSDVDVDVDADKDVDVIEKGDAVSGNGSAGSGSR